MNENNSCQCNKPQSEPTVQRKLTYHQIPGATDDLNSHIDIAVMDEPGPGGANHRYHLTIRHEQDLGGLLGTCCQGCEIEFQKGGVKEAGYNGISHEVLLAILIDRLEAFQGGPFPCLDNAYALSHLYAALQNLKDRTRKRMARGVEGQVKP